MIPVFIESKAKVADRADLERAEITGTETKSLYDETVPMKINVLAIDYYLPQDSYLTTEIMLRNGDTIIIEEDFLTFDFKVSEAIKQAV